MLILDAEHTDGQSWWLRLEDIATLQYTFGYIWGVADYPCPSLPRFPSLDSPEIWRHTAPQLLAEARTNNLT